MYTRPMSQRQNKQRSENLDERFFCVGWLLSLFIDKYLGRTLESLKIAFLNQLRKILRNLHNLITWDKLKKDLRLGRT